MAARLELLGLADFPLVEPGDNLVQLITASLAQNDIVLQAGDVLVIAQKIVSKAEGRYATLASVEPGERGGQLDQ